MKKNTIVQRTKIGAVEIISLSFSHKQISFFLFPSLSLSLPIKSIIYILRSHSFLFLPSSRPTFLNGPKWGPRPSAVRPWHANMRMGRTNTIARKRCRVFCTSPPHWTHTIRINYLIPIVDTWQLTPTRWVLYIGPTLSFIQHPPKSK